MLKRGMSPARATGISLSIGNTGRNCKVLGKKDTNNKN
jgi:hypothetical protein